MHEDQTGQIEAAAIAAAEAWMRRKRVRDRSYKFVPMATTLEGMKSLSTSHLALAHQAMVMGGIPWGDVEQYLEDDSRAFDYEAEFYRFPNLCLALASRVPNKCFLTRVALTGALTSWAACMHLESHKGFLQEIDSQLEEIRYLREALAELGIIGSTELVVGFNSDGTPTVEVIANGFTLTLDERVDGYDDFEDDLQGELEKVWLAIVTSVTSYERLNFLIKLPMYCRKPGLQTLMKSRAMMPTNPYDSCMCSWVHVRTGKNFINS